MNHKHVSLKTQCGHTPLLLNHWKLMTQRRKCQRNQEFKIPELDYVPQTTQPQHLLRSPLPKLHLHFMSPLPPNSDKQNQKTGMQ